MSQLGRQCGAMANLLYLIRLENDWQSADEAMRFFHLDFISMWAHLWKQE